MIARRSPPRLEPARSPATFVCISVARDASTSSRHQQPVRQPARDDRASRTGGLLQALLRDRGRSGRAVQPRRRVDCSDGPRPKRAGCLSVKSSTTEIREAGLKITTRTGQPQREQPARQRDVNEDGISGPTAAAIGNITLLVGSEGDEVERHRHWRFRAACEVGAPVAIVHSTPSPRLADPNTYPHPRRA